VSPASPDKTLDVRLNNEPSQTTARGSELCLPRVSARTLG
jgi:hypothetical protein